MTSTVAPSKRPAHKGLGRRIADNWQLYVLLLIPVVNVAAALILGFRQESNIHVRQYCRAFLLGTAVCMTAALTFFAVNYFADPAHYAFFDRIRLLFGA